MSLTNILKEFAKPIFTLKKVKHFLGYVSLLTGYQPLKKKFRKRSRKMARNIKILQKQILTLILKK